MTAFTKCLVLTGHTLRARPAEIASLALPAAVPLSAARAIHVVFSALARRVSPYSPSPSIWTSAPLQPVSAALPVAAEETEVAAGTTDDHEAVVPTAGASSCGGG